MRSIVRLQKFDGLVDRVTLTDWVQLLALCRISCAYSSLVPVFRPDHGLLEAWDKEPSGSLFIDDTIPIILRYMHRLPPTMYSEDVSICSYFLVLCLHPHCSSATYKKLALLSWWWSCQPPMTLFILQFGLVGVQMLDQILPVGPILPLSLVFFPVGFNVLCH